MFLIVSNLALPLEQEDSDASLGLSNFLKSEVSDFKSFSNVIGWCTSALNFLDLSGELLRMFVLVLTGGCGFLLRLLLFRLGLKSSFGISNLQDSLRITFSGTSGPDFLSRKELLTSPDFLSRKELFTPALFLSRKEELLADFLLSRKEELLADFLSRKEEFFTPPDLLSRKEELSALFLSPRKEEELLPCGFRSDLLSRKEEFLTSALLFLSREEELSARSYWNRSAFASLLTT